jgi:anti-sigma regulatory factor (Ser/Thr protein kinase)
MKSGASEWRVELPRTLEAVESFFVEFQRWRARACADVDAFATELLLREALTNSVVHGGGQDPSERITCVLRVKRGRLIMAIQVRASIGGRPGTGPSTTRTRTDAASRSSGGTRARCASIPVETE